MTTSALSDDLVSLITHTSDIVASHVSHNRVSPDQLPSLISSVYAALSGLGETPEPVAEPKAPAVPIRKSVTPDYLVCLEDGKKMVMLKRYLRTHYDMSPAEYRARWNLPSDYPMVAPNYAEKRRGIAKDLGLGRKASGEPQKADGAAPKSAD